MALKQRRGSIVYRMSMKPQLTDSQMGLVSSTTHLSTANEEPTRNGQPIRDQRSSAPLPETSIPITKKRSLVEEHVNGNHDGKDFPITRSKSIRSAGNLKKESLNHEKSSTTCIIQ